MRKLVKGALCTFALIGLVGIGAQAAKYKVVDVANGGSISGKVAAGKVAVKVKSFTISNDPQIWRDTDMFSAMRNPALQGRCGRCDYKKICGGCRARPLARSNELRGEDYLCSYRPQRGAITPGANQEYY